MITFKNAILKKGAYGVIDGKEYPVVMPEFEVETPFSAENLNKIQEDLKEMIDSVDSKTEDTGWIDITLMNGATARKGDEYKPAFRRIGSIVYIKGQITVPTSTTDITLFVLPENCRPNYEVNIASAYIKNVQMWIRTTGEVKNSKVASNVNFVPIQASYVVGV